MQIHIEQRASSEAASNKSCICFKDGVTENEIRAIAPYLLLAGHSLYFKEKPPEGLFLEITQRINLIPGVQQAPNQPKQGYIKGLKKVDAATAALLSLGQEDNTPKPK